VLKIVCKRQILFYDINALAQKSFPSILSETAIVKTKADIDSDSVFSSIAARDASPETLNTRCYLPGAFSTAFHHL